MSSEFGPSVAKPGGLAQEKANFHLVGVDHLEIEHPIKVKGDIVMGDSRLRGDLEGDLLEGLHVLDVFQEGNEQVQPGIQDPAELAKSLHNPRLLLRHKFDALEKQPDALGNGGVAVRE